MRYKPREVALAFGLLAPALILMLVFVFFPLAFGFYISLHDWRIVPRDFIGLDNYARALRPDSEMWPALLTTVLYSFLSVPVQLSIALVLAYLLYQKIRGKALFRVVVFLPYITSTVATAAVWARLLSPDLGIINGALKQIGVEGPKWLLENRNILEALFGAQNLPDIPSLALIAVIVYTTWVFVGYDMTIFLAGMGNIPADVYEAARMDGASGWKLFRYITLPLLSPTTFFLSLVTIIGTFKAFNHIWVMTQGDNGTTTASIVIYKQMYSFQRAGYASALAFMLMTVILIVTILQNRIAGRRGNY